MKNYTWKKLFIRKNCDVPTFCGVELTAYKEIRSIIKQHKEYLFGHFKDKHFNYYLKGLDERQIGRTLYKQRFFKPSKIIQAYKHGVKFLKLTGKKTKNWKIQTAKHPNPKLLYKAFEDFCKGFNYVNVHYSISPWWALEAWQHDFEDIIGRLIEKRKLGNFYAKIMGSLLQPWKQTAMNEVGNKVNKGVKISKLVSNYQFLRSWTAVWYKPITAQWIKSTAPPYIKTKPNLFNQNQIFQILKPSPKEKQFIKLAPYIVFFKDWRDDLRRKHAYDWSFLFDAIAKNFKMPRENLGYYTLDELAAALINNQLNISLLKQRKNKEFILTIEPKQLKLRVLPGVPAFYRKAIQQAEKEKSSTLVKGIIAQTGFVKGPARLVRNVHDIKKVETGDILVTNTTHPNYLQGMKKALAFVTDEGGIASHAAIVARELKIPCIVGTKIATKVFKDGDWVEVDANKGIVRKLT